MTQIMTQFRDIFRNLMPLRRSRNYQASYGSALIASQMEESASRIAEDTLMYELEALKELKTFEMEGSHCSYDPDQLLGLRVWNTFLQMKVKEIKSITGSSPELPEMNRLVFRNFDVIGAINQMIVIDPHLNRPLDQARRESLFKALGLLLKNEALDDSKTVATLSQFCRYHPANHSRDERLEAAVNHEHHVSQSTSVSTIYQPPSATQGNTEQVYEKHAETGVSEPSSSQYTSSLPGYQSPSGIQGTEQTEARHVEAGLSSESSSSQSTSALPDYQPQNIFQWAGQLGEEHAFTSYLKELGDSEGFVPTYTPTQLSYSPSRWRVVAQYRGLNSSAEAISKKAAKHLASKGLWAQLHE